MILPLAIVERSPMDEYVEKYKTLEESLKHNVTDAFNLYNELRVLKQMQEYCPAEDTKSIRSLVKQYNKIITEKEDRFLRLTKFSDYPALTMAAYPDAIFLSADKYKRKIKSIKDPILIRGIKTGSFAKYAEEHGRDYYFMETGYLGNYRSENNRTARKIYHRIEKNAMQQTRILEVPDDRWQALCKFNPGLEYRGWKKPGSKILLVLSTEKPFQHYGEDRETWIKNTIETIKAHTDREIVIREKAGRGERTNDTIYDALDNDIYALVTYNSIAAVEAIQYGIPAFALAPTAADPVGNKDLTQIENPNMPAEDIIQKWLWSISYGQFTIDELVSGQAWELVLANEQRPTINL